MKAAGADPNADNSVRQAVMQAAELAYPGTDANRLNMTNRYDLNEEVSRIDNHDARPVAFYSFSNVDSPSDEDSIWAVVSPDSRSGSEQMYSFESSDSIEQSSNTFNRLVAQMHLSVPDAKAIAIARFFLDCCVRREPGETVDDAAELEHLLERFYIRVYGDFWRALESSTQWWQGYEKNALESKPRVVVVNGIRQIILQRLILSFGMHPQLQEWDIAVDSDGTVRALAVEPIFPKQRRWLSYASRSTIGPHIP